MLILVLFFQLPASSALCETITHASEIKLDSVFNKFVHSYDFGKVLYQHAVFMDRKLGIANENKYQITPGKIGIMESVTMSDGDPYPSSGAWFHRYEITRGGETRTYNLCCLAGNGARPKAFPMIMGTTNASYLLMKDAQTSVYLAAYVKNENKWTQEEFKKGCVIADSTVVKVPHTIRTEGKVLKGVWVEKWIVRVVATEVTDVPVFIMFIPDEQTGGTSYTVLNEDLATQYVPDGK